MSIEFRRDFSTQMARAHAFLPQSVQGFLALGKFILEELIAWLTRPVEVFLRYRMGIRHHSLFNVVQLAGAGYFVYVGVGQVDSLFSVFWALSSLAGLYHWIEAYRFEKRGYRRYSWSNGDLLPFWNYAVTGLEGCGIRIAKWVTVERVALIGEPALCLILGIALQPVSKVLGVFLLGSAAALFIKALIMQQRLMNIKRDQWDARIFSQWLIGVQKPNAAVGERKVHVVRLALEIAPEEQPAPVTDTPDAAAVGAVQSEVSAAPPESCLPPTPKADSQAAEYLRLECSQCGHRLKVNRKHAGKAGKCKQCGILITVPVEEPVAAA